MNNIAILGAAGFIGTNLALSFSRDNRNIIKLVDEKEEYFAASPLKGKKNITYCTQRFLPSTNYNEILNGQDIVFHLISTNNPSSSNIDIGSEITDNIGISICILDACVKCNVKKVVFVSSGGTVYGKEAVCPISEIAELNPISTYGIQKLAIEKLFYLYEYLYGLDYVILRLANPYGPYQRPNGKLGVITTFLYKAVTGDNIEVFGDGNVIRDYIYISDAVDGILRVLSGHSKYKIFNIGSGKGVSINDIISIMRKDLKLDVKVLYKPKRKVDVPVNYLDMTRFNSEYGVINYVSLQEGMKKTLSYLRGEL